VVVESEGLSFLGHSGGGCSRGLSLLVAVRVELVVD
jgi:hypothetical protein